jgi:hypothetical protein
LFTFIRGGGNRFSECNVEHVNILKLSEGFYFSAVLLDENSEGSRASLLVKQSFKT